jgi:hypothetical protein
MKRLEIIKYDKYKTIYARAGVDFMPLALEHGASVVPSRIQFRKF